VKSSNLIFLVHEAFVIFLPDTSILHKHVMFWELNTPLGRTLEQVRDKLRCQILLNVKY